jgi:hypothetical protein
MTTTPTSRASNTAYRNGLCIDCRTTRYSPGRPRCNDCHAVWQQPPLVVTVEVENQETWEQRLARFGLITTRTETD